MRQKLKPQSTILLNPFPREYQLNIIYLLYNWSQLLQLNRCIELKTKYEDIINTHFSTLKIQYDTEGMAVQLCFRSVNLGQNNRVNIFLKNQPEMRYIYQYFLMNIEQKVSYIFYVSNNSMQTLTIISYQNIQLIC